jgi:hypothetical protein
MRASSPGPAHDDQAVMNGARSLPLRTDWESAVQRRDVSINQTTRNLERLAGMVLLIGVGQFVLLWFCAFGSTVWAYALMEGLYYPMPSITSQVELAAKLSISTAFLALGVSILALVKAPQMTYRKAMLISGLGTEGLLIIRGLISSNVFFEWNARSSFVRQFASPSLLFGEYNFLTYIFEVGICMSAAAGLLTLGTIWIKRRISTDFPEGME